MVSLRPVLAAFLVCAVLSLLIVPGRAAPPPEAGGLPGPTVPGGWGVNIHFTDPATGEMARFAQAGYRFARMDFFWSAVEKGKGVYDFSAYDRLASELAKVGARPLFILDYGNDLYQTGAPRTPEAVAAFARFAGAASAHFKNKNVVWEIWNEPNLGQFWRPQPDPEQYATLALATAKAVRAADPNATIIAPGASGFPWEFLEAVFKRGLLTHVDAVSVHPYRGQNPETAADDFARLRVLIARHAPEGKRDLPIVSSEWGYSTFAPGGVSEAQQARYLVRQWLANMASGVNLSIFYDWKDDGDDPKENEHRFGTVRRDLSPKPAFAAAKELIGALNGYTFRHRLKPERPYEWRLLFQRKNDLRLVTWWNYRGVDFAGEEETPVTRAISSQDAEYVRLRRAASIHYTSWPIAASSQKWTPAEFTVVNPEERPATVMVSLDSNGTGSRTVIIPPGEQKRLSLRVPVPSLRSPEPTTFPVFVTWNGEPLPELPDLVRVFTNPIILSAAPRNGKLSVTLEYPAGEAFTGTIVVTDNIARLGRPARVLQSEPVHLKQGGRRREVLLRLPPAATRHAVQLFAGSSATGFPVASTPARSFVPFADFPGQPAEPPGFDQVLFVENVAQKPVPLSVVKTEGGSPAPAALAFRYTFDKGWQYAQAVPTKPKPAAVPKGASALLVWVRTNDSGDALRARFRDATGQTFQADLGQMTKTEWRLVTIPLDGTHSGVHWGGANDGVPHAPLTWEALILVDSANREVAHTGEVLIAAPTYVLPSPR